MDCECGLDKSWLQGTALPIVMMGSHQLLAKTVMYEESVRVPWLMRLPQFRRKQRIVREPHRPRADVIASDECTCRKELSGGEPHACDSRQGETEPRCVH